MGKELLHEGTRSEAAKGGGEQAWRMADVEDIILAARNLAMACIGGQVQFRLSGGCAPQKIRTPRIYSPQIRMKHTVAPPSTLVPCSQLHENSSFPASLGFYPSRSDPGLSAAPAVGDAFERCPQSENIFLR